MKRIIKAIVMSLRQSDTDFDVVYEQVSKHFYNRNQFTRLTGEFKLELRKLFEEMRVESSDALAGTAVASDGLADIDAELNQLLETGKTGDDSEKTLEDEVSTEQSEEIVIPQDLQDRVEFLIMSYTDWDVQKGDVICEEYKAYTQLKILGIELKDIDGPVPDIGCGEHGNLVRFLRTKKFICVGVDRVVEEEKFLRKADWLKIKLGEEKWGTIISHMAFTNHFNYQHKYAYGIPEDYAKTYMHILKALKVGGSFYYAPGVDFIESLLDTNQYQIWRTPIRDNITSVRIKRMY